MLYGVLELAVTAFDFAVTPQIQYFRWQLVKQTFGACQLVKVKIKDLNYFICDGFCDIGPLDSLQNVKTSYRGVFLLVRIIADLEPQTLDLETKTLLQKVFTFCKKVNSLLLSKTLYMVLFIKCFLCDFHFSTNYV